MMKHFRIGAGDWLRTLRRFTDPFDPTYWSEFRPVPEGEIVRCERAIHRRLPEDFRVFYREVGCGPFHAGGNIYEPDDLIAAVPGPLLMVLGSTAWADDEAHLRFYATRGAFNPDPGRFTPAAMQHQGVNLLDLVQVGTDGMCCYHVLNVGAGMQPFGYALLTPDLECQLPSFSDGLRRVLMQHAEWARER